MKTAPLLRIAAPAVLLSIASGMAAAADRIDPRQFGLPGTAAAGECFTKVYYPTEYRTKTERVLVKQAGERIEVTPPIFDTVTDRILVQEAAERYEVTPALYETRTERVMVRPATSEWKLVKNDTIYGVLTQTNAVQTRIDEATGEVMCKIEVPAKYETIEKQVLVAPPRLKTVRIPEKYETIKRRVLKQPASQRRLPIREEYKTIVTQELAKDAELGWVSVLCQTNLSASTVRDVQTRLKQAGHYAGPIDGLYGNGTAAAVKKYQRANGIAPAGLTADTLRRMGVTPRGR